MTTMGLLESAIIAFNRLLRPLNVHLESCTGNPAEASRLVRVLPLFERLGYEIRCIAVYREDHWWCQSKGLG